MLFLGRNFGFGLCTRKSKKKLKTYKNILKTLKTKIVKTFVKKTFFPAVPHSCIIFSSTYCSKAALSFLLHVGYPLPSLLIWLS